MRNRFGNEVVPAETRNDALQSMAKGTYSNSGELISYSYYDTYAIDTTVTSFKLFSVPLNQGGKDLGDTNWLLAGQTPANQKFIATGIKIVVLGLSGMDETIHQPLFEYLFASTARFNISGKDDIGCFSLAELLGSNIMLSQAATFNNGEISSVPRFPLAIPIVLGGNTTFGVQIDAWKGSSAYIDDVKIKFIMNGSLQRLS